MREMRIKYKVLSITRPSFGGKGLKALFLILIALFLLHIINYQLPTVSAQLACPAAPPATARSTGLISSNQNLSGFNTTAGACVIHQDRAPFRTFRVPTYQDLLSKYFTQAKDNPTLLINKNNPITSSATQSNIPMGVAEDQLWNIQGNLDLSSAPSGNKTGVVFVSGDLTISPTGNQLIYGDANSGLVFVVGGNVIIAQSVTRIDAVIISSGIIYTAGLGCATSSVLSNQLIINGSLITLSNRIQLCRTLADNSIPAERVDSESKYLIILRNLFSEKVQKWSEVTGTLPIFSPPPP